MPVSNPSLPSVPDGLHVDDLRLDGAGVVISARTIAAEAAYPSCGQVKAPAPARLEPVERIAHAEAFFATIRKYLRSDAKEPLYRAPERPSKLDPFAAKLSGWLKTEANRLRKQRRTGREMHAGLVLLGYDGSCGRVAAFIRSWKEDRQTEQQTTGRATFVPLAFGISAKPAR